MKKNTRMYRIMFLLNYYSQMSYKNLMNGDMEKYDIYNKRWATLSAYVITNFKEIGNGN